MNESDKLNRVVDARMKLKARFEEKIRQTPSVADDRPQGKGEPDVPLEEWQLKVDGAVEHPVTLTWTDFMALPQTEDTSDFHCMTTWSKLNMNWKGVRRAGADDHAAVIRLEGVEVDQAHRVPDPQ